MRLQCIIFQRKTKDENLAGENHELTKNFKQFFSSHFENSVNIYFDSVFFSFIPPSPSASSHNVAVHSHIHNNNAATFFPLVASFSCLLVRGLQQVNRMPRKMKYKRENAIHKPVFFSLAVCCCYDRERLQKKKIGKRMANRIEFSTIKLTI